jgi:FMN reductase
VDAVYACDAMIWSSPTYHGSVSGSFKNALDWLILLAERDPPYLTNKPVVGCQISACSCDLRR